MPRQIIPSAEWPRILSEYKSGRTGADLADEYGVSEGAIYRITSRAGANNLKREGSDRAPRWVIK